MVRGLASFDGRAAFGTWAYRVATNACLDELRRRRRRPEPGLPEGNDPAALVDSLAGAGARLDIDRALARLPAEFRVAVVLRDVCDLTYAEIADMLDLPPGTVRSRIARGRAALAPMLSEHGPAFDGGNPGPSPGRPRPRG